MGKIGREHFFNEGRKDSFSNVQIGKKNITFFSNKVSIRV